MAAWNILAAVLLALMPALEPCRLHAVFACPQAQESGSESGHAENGEACHHHSHGDKPEEPTRCPDCPKVCNHLSNADGLPAQAAVSVVIPAVPCIVALATFAAPASAQVQAWAYQHPPPTVLDLVGTTTLRI